MLSIISYYLLTFGVSSVVYSFFFIFSYLSGLELFTYVVEPTALFATLIFCLFTGNKSHQGQIKSYGMKRMVFSLVSIWAATLCLKKIFELFKKGFLSKTDHFRASCGRQLTKYVCNLTITHNTFFPAFFLLLSKYSNNNAKLIQKFAVLVWLYGYMFTVTAWIQKYIFKRTNSGEFMSKGLWKLCRYPDYHGELFSCLGLYIICAIPVSPLYIFIELFISPIFRLFTIYAVNGIWTNDKIAEERYGHRNDWIAYVYKTPSLLPFTKLRD